MPTPTVTIIHHDWGVTIRVEMFIDLTGYTELQMYFRKADKTQVVKAVADGVGVFGADADGIIQWDTTADFFLDSLGTWRVQPRATFANAIYTGWPAAAFTIEDLFQT